MVPPKLTLLCARFITCVLSYATAINENGKVVGALAEDWYSYYDAVYDEYQMFFVLRDSYWNDGRKVSADDVIYAWKRILDPAFESPYASLLFPIKNARAVFEGDCSIDDLGVTDPDALVLEITFEEEPDYDAFIRNLTSIALVPLREDKAVVIDDWAE